MRPVSFERSTGIVLATKKKDAYESRYTCQFDRQYEKQGLYDRDPEHNTPKHRSG
jgi:hypothetical protein